jgi:hypothetical protein
MKKLLLAFAALVIALSLWAQEYPADEIFWEETEDGIVMSDEDGDVPEDESEGGSRRVKNRGFELGIVNLNVNLANSFMGVGEFFRETVSIDIENFEKGFRFGFGADVRPIFFNVNLQDRWGFGMDIARVTAYGNIDISGNLLRIKRTDGDNFGVGAAVFADVGFPAFFHVKDFKIKDFEVKDLKIKIRPAVFATIGYTVPDMRYTYKNRNDGSLIEIAYAVQVYTPFSLDENNPQGFTGSAIGVDLGAGREFQKYSWLDLGVDITNIPLIPSKMSHYMRIKDKVFVDSSKINLTDLLDGKDLPEDVLYLPENFDPVYGTKDRLVLRPFKMVFRADYRPLETRLLSIIPTLGFSVNGLYVSPGSIEAGVKVRCDMENRFIVTLGLMNYEDRLWKNSIDLVLNLRAVEIDLGIAMQSQDFAKSWQAAGLSIDFGLKFGW